MVDKPETDVSSSGVDYNKVAVLNDQYQILPYDSATLVEGIGGKSFRAGEIGKGVNEAFAIVGDTNSYFRFDVADKVKSFNHRHTLRLLSWGIVNWPPDKRRRLALIYEAFPGVPLVHSIDDDRNPVAETELISNYLLPLIGVVKAFHDRDVMHGSIRPTNCFQQANKTLLLGDCLSTPPSEMQPVSLLTVERGMAHPHARGDGNPSDDIYALAGTLIYFVMGYNSLRGLSDQKILERKLNRGSFTAFTSSYRFSPRLAELFRGMLNDDAANRWTMDEVEKWVSGKRVGNPPLLSARPTRSFTVGGVEYWDVKSIAQALSRNINEAYQLIDGGDLLKWIRRGLIDEAIAERVIKAIESANSRRVNGPLESRLVAKVIAALDPSGPIRYQNLSVMPDGIGTALVKAFSTDQPTKAIGEMLSGLIPSFWYSQKTNENNTYKINTFDHLRAVINRGSIGYGTERCLYELVPWTCCKTPDIASFFVDNPKLYLEAMEVAAAERSGLPIDRHGAAFLGVWDEPSSEVISNRLEVAVKEIDRVVAMLEILAGLQRRANLPKLPNLAAWFDTLLQPKITELHNRVTREKIKTLILEAAKKGSLTEMLQIIQNPVQTRQDREGYLYAKRQHMHMNYQIEQLRHEIAPGSQLHRNAGKESATIIAAIISIFVFIGVILMHAGGI